MPVTELSDVDVRAISLVKKGANRQRIFMWKCDEELFKDEDLKPLPHGPLVKNMAGDDWTAFYAVVAEPGALEQPGRTGELEDRWASEEEIQKAAWRFMKNGALVNKMHETLDPYGHIVENAIAVADFTVNGQTIKKGSWYVAIEPSDEAREQINKGEIEGISIEGWGNRTTVEKAQTITCTNCGWSGSVSEKVKPGSACPRCGKPLPGPVAKELWDWYDELVKTHAGENPASPIRHLTAFYMKKPHPFAACVRDNRKRFGPRTEAICAGLKDVALQTHRWRAQFKGKPGYVAKDEAEVALNATYDACDSIWTSHSLTQEDAILALQSIAWHEGRNEGRVKKFLRKLGEANGLSKEDLAELDEPVEPDPEKEGDEVGLSKEESDRLEAVEKSVADLGPKLDSLATSIEKIAKPEAPEPTLEEVKKDLGDVDSKLDDLAAKIEKLGEGQSSTDDDEGTNGSRSKVEKSDPLAGLLLDS